MELGKRIGLFFALMTMFVSSVYSQTTVEFYSTVTTSSDDEMISMTTDLFFTQMQGLDGYVVTDKRSQEFTGADGFVSDIAFFAEIQESDDGWICTLNAVNRLTSGVVRETKTYASYYKILLDAKSSLENVLANIDSQAVSSGSANESSSMAVTLDTLAGTWVGDTLVDKIVILRGGKGFVIFKNGASMNIGVELDGAKVVVTQKGRSNASFYPELSRELALKNVATASPIKWNLVAETPNNLRGEKTTLAEDSKSSTGASVVTISVEWEKVGQ